MSTEDLILKAAEEEFLSKGYDKSKISTIAEKAEVNHAMVHYYFRTKENLFDIVFQKKVGLLANQLGGFEETGDFIEQLRVAIKYHFDFLVNNPNLLMFLLRELSTNSVQLERLKQILLPKILGVNCRLQKAIDREAKKGKIKAISATDLLLNVASMNASSILFVTVRKKLDLNVPEDFLNNRREHIVESILNSIIIK